MSRIVRSTILILAIAIVAVSGGTDDAQAAPPATPGVAAQVAALQAAVASLTGQLATLTGQLAALQTAVAALQGAGTGEVWHGSNGSAAVQQNSATFVNEWTLSSLVSLSLPAGTFFLEAKTSVLDQLVDSGFYCAIEDSTHGNAVLPLPTAPLDWSWDFAPTDEPATLALQAVVTLASPDTVALRCGSTGGDSSASQSKLDAIKVGAVH